MSEQNLKIKEMENKISYFFDMKSLQPKIGEANNFFSLFVQLKINFYFSFENKLKSIELKIQKK